VATLDSKLGEVVGGNTAKALERAFGMHTVRDLLSHYPRRLAERGELTDLASLRVDEDVTVVADVQSSAVKGAPRNQRLEVIIGEGAETLQLVFFGGRTSAERETVQPERLSCPTGRHHPGGVFSPTVLTSGAR